MSLGNGLVVSEAGEIKYWWNQPIYPLMSRIAGICLFTVISLGQDAHQDLLRIPKWFTFLEPQNQKIDSQTAEALNLSYDSDVEFSRVIGHYELTFRQAGLSFSENGNGHGATFNISSHEISCKVDVGSQAKPHVEMQCSGPRVQPSVALRDPKTVSLHSQTTADRFTFRKRKWGMTRQQVAASESPMKIETADGGTKIGGFLTIDGRKMGVLYDFADDRLARASYVLAEKYNEPTAYMAVLRSIEDALTEKYGPPVRNILRWDDDLYKNNPDRYGIALAAGHLLLGHEWETGETKIVTVAHGQNFSITLMVRYTSKQFEAALTETDNRAHRAIY